MSQRPSHVLDRIFLVDGFDLIEERVDRIFEFRVNVQRQPRLRDFGRDATPLDELIRSRVRLHQEHRIVERPVHAFAIEDVIEHVRSLKELHLRDLRQCARNLLRRRAGADSIDAKHSQIQLPLIFPSLVDRQQFVFAACAADRGETIFIQILDHRRCAGFQLLRRSHRKLRCQRAKASLVDSSGWRIHAKRLNRAAVQIRFVIGGLQQDGIFGRDAIQFGARERPFVVGKLIDGPSAEVVNPFAGLDGLRARAQKIERLFA